MDDLVAVQVGQPLHHLPAHVGDLLLRQALLQVHDDRVQGPAVAVLDEDLQEERVKIEVDVIE